MAFSDLSPTLQDLLTQQYIFIGKAVFLLAFLLISIVVINYWKPKKSPFLGVKLIRGLAFYVSWAYVVTAPLMTLLLAPQVPFSVVVQLVLVIYLVIMVLMGMIFVINFVFHGAHFASDLVTGENNFNKASGEILKPFK